jgi:hypothetical protein
MEAVDAWNSRGTAVDKTSRSLLFDVCVCVCVCGCIY